MMTEIHAGIKDMNSIALKEFNKNEQDLFKEYIEKNILNLKNLPVNQIDIKVKKQAL